MAWWEKYEAVGKTTVYNSQIAEARLTDLVFRTSFNPDSLVPVAKDKSFTVSYNWVEFAWNIDPNNFSKFKLLITNLVREYYEKYSSSWWFYSTESILSKWSDNPIILLNVDNRFTDTLDTTVLNSDDFFAATDIKIIRTEQADKIVMSNLARFLNEIVKTPKLNDNHDDSQTPQLQIVSW